MSVAPQPQPPKDFESAMTELEGLVERLESGQLSLEDSLAAYRRGMELAAFCEKTLSAAELQVKQLENGELTAFQPGEDAAA